MPSTALPDAMVTRRETIIAAGSIALGAGAVSSVPEKANAQVTVGDFSVSNVNKATSQPINGARVTVDGSYSWDAPTITPTRVVLRLEGKETGDWQQLAAQELPNTESSGNYSLSGNLLDLSGVTAPDLTPANVGDSVETNISLRVKLSVYDDGKKLTEQSAQDTATVGVTKTETQVDVQLGGSGNISLSSG